MAPAKKSTKAATTKESVPETPKDNVPVTRKRTRGATASSAKEQQQQKISTPEKKIKKDKPIASKQDVVDDLDVASAKEKKESSVKEVCVLRKIYHPS